MLPDNSGVVTTATINTAALVLPTANANDSKTATVEATITFVVNGITYPNLAVSLPVTFAKSVNEHYLDKLTAANIEQAATLAKAE